MENKYSDKGDTITATMIRASKRYEAYWDGGEKRVLDGFEQRVRGMGCERLHCLDAGCGDGRLLTTFAPL